MTDEQRILNLLRGLLCCEELPADCLPIDLLQIVKVLVQQAAGGEVAVAHNALAQHLSCSESVIKRSQTRLKDFGWLAVHSGKRRAHPNKLTVLTDALPVGDLTRTVVSEEAKTLAVRYGSGLRSINKKRRLFKGWQGRFAHTLQLFLTKCDGDAAKLTSVVNFAFDTPLYFKRAVRGPHALRPCWKGLLKAHDDAERQQREAPPTPPLARVPIDWDAIAAQQVTR